MSFLFERYCVLSGRTVEWVVAATVAGVSGLTGVAPRAFCSVFIKFSSSLNMASKLSRLSGAAVDGVSVSSVVPVAEVAGLAGCDAKAVSHGDTVEIFI